MQNSNSKENQMIINYTPYNLPEKYIEETILNRLRIKFIGTEIIKAPSAVYGIKYNEIELPLLYSVYSTASIDKELLLDRSDSECVRNTISFLTNNAINLLVRHIKYRIIQQHSKQINDYKGISIIALNVKTNKMESYSNLAIQLVICVKFGILFSKTNPIVEKLLSYCNHCPNRLICALKPSAVENENDKKLLCPILKGTI